MKHFGVLLLVIALMGIARAQMPYLGSCPEYPPKVNFDMDRFTGIWYEAEHSFQLTEIANRCVRSNYTKAPDGKYHVINEIRNRITGVKRLLEGELRKSPSKAEEGRLHVKYTTVPFIPFETQYIVLDTDYERFAVLWSCVNAGLVHAQNAWIMTRERLPPGETLQKAYGVLDQYKISKAFFFKTIQEDCGSLDDAELTEPPKGSNEAEEEQEDPTKTAVKSANAGVSDIQSDAPAPIAQPEKVAEEKIDIKSVEAQQPIAVAAVEPIKAAEKETVKNVAEIIMKTAEQAKEAVKEPIISEPVKEIKESAIHKHQEPVVVEQPKESAPIIIEQEQTQQKQPEIETKKAEYVEEKIEIVKP